MPWTGSTIATPGLSVPSGTALFVLIQPGAVSIVNMGAILFGAGVTPTGYNGLGLYNASGNLIDKTADMSSLFASTPPAFIEGVLSQACNLTADTNYYFAVLTHFTTVPRIGGAQITNNFPSIKGNFASLAIAGQATFPNSFNPATAAKNNGAYFLSGS